MKNYTFITGSSDRIGKAIAIESAQQGQNIILHYNSSKTKAEKLQLELQQQYKVEVEILQIDFLDTNNFNSVFKSLKNQNIKIDILVNCASDFQRSTFDKAGDDLLQKEIAINFTPIYLLTKAYAKVYTSGHIINFLDTKVTKNATDRLDYILSKKLLKDFTKISAVELAPNIKVNAIAPGLVLPPPDQDEDYLLNLAKEIPLQTIGNMEEILKAFRFLIDSNFVTGQILYIDGGDHLI